MEQFISIILYSTCRSLGKKCYTGNTFKYAETSICSQASS